MNFEKLERLHTVRNAIVQQATKYGWEDDSLVDLETEMNGCIKGTSSGEDAELTQEVMGDLAAHPYVNVLCGLREAIEDDKD